MQTVTMEEAKAQLPDLIEAASNGRPFRIAQEGKPDLEIIVTQVPVARTRQGGFMKGEMLVPDDFDTMGRQEIHQMFGIED